MATVAGGADDSTLVGRVLAKRRVELTRLLADGHRSTRPTDSSLRLRMLCGLVNATTAGLALAAVVVLVVARGRLVGWVVAAVLVVLVVTTLPPRVAPPDPRATLTRPDAPTLFALLDRLGAALGTPPPANVVLRPNGVAAAGDSGRRAPYVAVGAMFPTLVPRHLRVAVVAHELAHLAADDPFRRRPVRRAMHALSCWHDRLMPPRGTMAAISLAGWYLVAPFAMVARAACRGMAGLIVDAALRGSVAAEYRADAHAAAVVGTDASVAALETIVGAPALHRELVRWAMTHQRWDDPWELLGEAWHDAIRTQGGELARQARADREPHADDTHPPLGLRIEALERSPVRPAQDWSDVDWKTIEREWSAIHESVTRQLLMTLHDDAVQGRR